NPYLALGGLLAAGLDGVRRVLEPPEPTMVDPGNYSDGERAARRIERFPATLAAALDRLGRHPAVQEAPGRPLARSFLALTRAECEACGKEDAAFEQRHHFWKF